MPSRAAKPTEDAWSPLDFDQEAFRAGASEHSFKRFARQGVRTLHAHEGGSGTSDTVRLDQDLLLTVINCVLPRTTRWRYDTDEALIMLRASLCCDVAFEVGSSAQLVFNRPEVTLVCLPKGRPQTVDIAGGVRQQGLVAIFRASAFAARYGLLPGDLPPLVRDAVTGSAEVGRIASFPLDHRLAALLADTIDTRLEGEMRVLQYAGRLAELVAYTLDAMQHVPLLRGTALNRLRDVELAHAALARLEHSYRKPPLFAELASEIGTNQNKLKAVFKEAFGVTMAEYCLERRMREAQQLLLAATLTIAQVAERVGYGHQSSFAAAFSGHVGMSPRQYRQHRAPFNLSLNAGDVGDPART
ncbi:AraC family transcriptional regulator [Ideonella sp. A 288]|uniref:helix-turn-helix transcriptional regulator n=1 Tax=Ideonella sp. A 288 TaxID=1962181 RepID=UPI000B4C1744|nr:AraC family transcriptional regulator [Ideonella sp. A 288]